MEYSEFQPMFQRLTYQHKCVIIKIMSQLAKQCRLEPQLGKNLKKIREEEKIKYSDLVDDIYETKEEIELSIRKSVSRESKTSVYSEMIAENLGISENELLYGKEYISKLEKYRFNVEEMYSSLEEKEKKVVVTLVRYFWIEDNCPEYWEIEDTFNEEDNYIALKRPQKKKE